MKKREIKFRIWDGKEISNWKRIKNLVGLRVLTDAPEWTFLQYTGQKDKNGKEIYEGDILNYDTEGFAGGLNGIVEWIGSGFYLAKHIPIPEILKKDAEVIGNIYENPELLKP